jgi:hypothetical protein
VQPQLQEGAVIGGRLDGDAVAGLQQGLEQEHEALQRAVGHEDLVGRDPVLGGQHLAQWRVAVAGAVREHPHAVVLEGGAGAVGDQIRRERLRAGGSAGEGDRRRHDDPV